MKPDIATKQAPRPVSGPSVVAGARAYFRNQLLLLCYVVVFFTLTDRASTIPSYIRGCQSGTWSVGHEKIRGTSTNLQREHENRNRTENDRKKGTTTQSTYQKKIEEGSSLERV